MGRAELLRRRVRHCFDPLIDASRSVARSGLLLRLRFLSSTQMCSIRVEGRGFAQLWRSKPPHGTGMFFACLLICQLDYDRSGLQSAASLIWYLGTLMHRLNLDSRAQTRLRTIVRKQGVSWFLPLSIRLPNSVPMLEACSSEQCIQLRDPNSLLSENPNQNVYRVQIRFVEMNCTIAYRSEF